MRLLKRAKGLWLMVTHPKLAGAFLDLMVMGYEAGRNGGDSEGMKKHEPILVGADIDG